MQEIHCHIVIRKGCHLSQFLWNLKVDGLPLYIRDKIQCDMQGFVDKLALLARLEGPAKCVNN